MASRRWLVQPLKASGSGGIGRGITRLGVLRLGVGETAGAGAIFVKQTITPFKFGK